MSSWQVGKLIDWQGGDYQSTTCWLLFRVRAALGEGDVAGGGVDVIDHGGGEGRRFGLAIPGVQMAWLTREKRPSASVRPRPAPPLAPA